MSKTFTTEEQAKIAKHREMAESVEFRQELFRHFAPKFYFSAGEENFPSHPDAFLKNVIEAKHEYYATHDATKFNETELKERDVINKYFWKDGRFNPNYDQHRHEKDYQEVTWGAGAEHFLTFNEKKYGYKLGEKIDVIGVAPKGHPNYDPNKPSAPIASSVIPTPDGFFLQYDYSYPLNHAIPGMQWLYKLLPDAVSQKFTDFGFHYGDCEGVGVHVKVDDKGDMSFQSLQTFAHGSSGARNVPAKDCTFENGKVCVFVGEGPHPSYADKFIGRSKFADRVGTKYSLVPEKFVDVSGDLMEIANGNNKDPAISKEKLEAADSIPKSWHAVRRMAGGNPLSTDGIRTPEELLSDKQVKKWNGYKPFQTLDKAWNKVKSFIGKALGRQMPPRNPPDVIGADVILAKIRPRRESLAQSPSHSQNQGKWATSVGTKEERAVQQPSAPGI